MSELNQIKFYQNVLKKILNIVNKNDVMEKELENPVTKLDCNKTDYYNNIFSQIRAACIISDEEIISLNEFNIPPNELIESVERGELDISTL
jgi:hypothetical protein